jgi:endonuclease YncB( thermonuclease family)
MRMKSLLALLFALSMFAAAFSLARAGDSLYGKVTEVPSAVLVVLKCGTVSYDIRLIGIDADGPLAAQAREFVSKLIIGKNARARFEARESNGEMLSRLFTDDQAGGIKDVGLELVRAGLARRQTGADYQFDYKYGELSAAEGEAQAAKRGIWATAAPQ